MSALFALTHTESTMKHDDKYEDIKKSLLEDIAKGCDEEVVQRARGLFEVWESCTTAAPDSSNLPNSRVGTRFTASFNSDEDVKRLTTVNALAVLAMLGVTVVALVARK